MQSASRRLLSSSPSDARHFVINERAGPIKIAVGRMNLSLNLETDGGSNKVTPPTRECNHAAAAGELEQAARREHTRKRFSGYADGRAYETPSPTSHYPACVRYL